jgi:HEAT repeat protein
MNFVVARAKTQIVAALILFLLACATFTKTTFSQNPVNFEEFVKKLASGSVEEKRDVLYAIRNIQTEEASRIAIPALTDISEIVRATAVASVAFIEKDKVSAILTPLLNDPSNFVRRETAYALGGVRSADSVNSLINLQQYDKDLEVRTAAAIALGQIGEIYAVKSLTEILETKPKLSETFLRRSAALSIGQIARNLQFREFAKSEPASIFDESNWAARNPKYVDLTRMPEFKLASIALIKMLQNEKDTYDAKREAAFALGEISDPNALAALQNLMNTDDIYLAEISAKSSKKLLNLNP